MFHARFGLSGFADPALQRALYPDAAPHELLRRYGDRFDLYEVAPAAEHGFTAAHAEGLLDHAPTHLRLLPRIPAAPTPHQLEDWCERLRPVLRNHRCGPLHLAWSGTWSPAEEARLEDTLSRLYTHLPASGRVAVEFLHASWLRPGAMRLLEENEVGLVWSTRAGTLPYKVTADFLYVRLTGVHHRRCRDEVSALLDRVRARHGEQKPIYAVSTRSGEPYGLHALERFARGLGRPLSLGPATPPGQSALDRFAVPA